MTLEIRIRAFALLGKEIEGLLASGQDSQEVRSLLQRAAYENPWFTADNVTRALKGIAVFLREEPLRKWLADYTLSDQNQKTIGVAMAGNIPLVGFHDALCVLIAGFRLKAKLSSLDTILMKEVLQRLIRIEPLFETQIEIAERLNAADAMIATGGNNTARYFEYYFRNIPHIIRHNRTSCAILNGRETADDLDKLAIDVFSYFGLGCRNVSKLYIPQDFDFISLMARWESFSTIAQHNKYANNYTYQRGIMLMNNVSFYDNGAILLRNDAAMVSPISILYYEFYDDAAALKKTIDEKQEQIQCIVSANGWFPSSIEFGMAQHPAIDDYADGVDTMKFLEKIATAP